MRLSLILLLFVLLSNLALAEDIKIYSTTANGIKYYHIEYTLTPGNTLLTLDTYYKYGPSKYDFHDGLFEIFIPKEKFPIAAPNCKSHIILRMPMTLGDIPKKDEYIAEKRKLYDRIKEMKETGKGAIDVVIEMPDGYAEVINEDQLMVELAYCNVFFREAYGRYIDYVGLLEFNRPRVNKIFDTEEN